MRLMNLIILALFALPISAFAQVTYTYIGAKFTYAGNTVTDQLAYNTDNELHLSFVLSAPITGSITSTQNLLSWQVSDDTQSFDSSIDFIGNLFLDFANLLILHKSKEGFQ